MTSTPAPQQVAVIGAGPAGLFAVKALLDTATGAGRDIRVSVMDRLPTPFGLLRYGVAPDHASFQKVREMLAQVLADPRVEFIGGVELGTTVTREELLAQHEAVIYAVGASRDMRLGCPGDELPNSIPAGWLVGWYTGHPEARHRHLTGVRDVAVVGAGNVAIDVARVLAAPPGHLAGTEAPQAVQDELDEAKIREVWLLARRGPQHAAFTTPELKELAGLDGIAVVLHGTTREECAALAESPEVKALERRVRQNLTALSHVTLDADDPTADAARARVHLSFWSRPHQLVPGPDGSVAHVVIDHTRLEGDAVVSSGAESVIEAQLVVAAVGYKGVPLPGVPYDERTGIIPNLEGQVTDAPGGPLVPGEFVVGWAKRGATGIIGTAKSDATETVRHVAAYLGLSD